VTYKVPYIDLPAQYRSLESDILATLKQVLLSGSFILRDEVQKFEKNMALFLGAKHVVGVNSGTDALYLALRAAGIAPGDEVITVSHTFVATIATIVHCGSRPVLVDVGEDFNMDMQQVEGAITPHTRAIVPVHLNGRLCDMETVLTIAQRHNLLVVEDAAQALGTSFNGKKAGTFGLVGCFSLHPIKNLSAAGDAGFVATQNEELADKIRLLRNHGQRTKEDLACFGFNSRLDNLQAAILNVKLKYLPQWIERRREVARIYHRGLSSLPSLKLPPPPQLQGSFDTYNSYVVRAQERDRLVNHLAECGIEVFVQWPKPLHLQEALGLGHFHLPRTESLAKEIVSLPINAEISNQQVEFVIESIHNFYQKINSF